MHTDATYSPIVVNATATATCNRTSLVSLRKNPIRHTNAIHPRAYCFHTLPLTSNAIQIDTEANVTTAMM